MSSARITSYLVKIASRCNLDCDYCYVYHHADQSWRSMPRLLSHDHQIAFARRLDEYCRSADVRRAAVILHGGEPLLAGVDRISEFVRLVRTGAPSVEVEFGLQTNGLLLTDHVLDVLEGEDVQVSLSMDGPRQAHDLHRTTRRGRSSFDRVEAALERLKRRPAIFAGVIAVVDASVPAERLLRFFADHAVPKLDFLLPDAHHARPPEGRATDPGLYERWLIEGFDAWLDRHPDLRVRTFEALLDAAAGLPSGTDAFGLGDVSLLSVETDGTWHDLDVFKVAGEGGSRLFGSVEDTSIERIASSTAIAAHRRLLTRSGLSEQCRSCAIVEVCGGGSVPHRFGEGGFDNPTVYCSEMKALVAHVRHRLAETLTTATTLDDYPPGFDVDAFELAETGREIVAELHDEALRKDEEDLVAAVDLLEPRHRPTVFAERSGELARRAGTVAWQRALRRTREGRVVHDVDGTAIEVDEEYLFVVAARPAKSRLEVGADDEWLRKPFGSGIEFEPPEVAEAGRALVLQALKIVRDWRPAVADEIEAICSAVQFVRDPSAHPDKIVSFSDDSVPGALFVSIVNGSGLIDPYDLADSLVHEYRHQKLYLYERRHATTLPGALVVSPWREDPRPVSGLLHAAFVFVELRRFWEHVRDHGPTRLNNRAVAQLEDTEDNLQQAFSTLRSCRLTLAGRALADVLESRKRRLPLAA